MIDPLEDDRSRFVFEEELELKDREVCKFFLKGTCRKGDRCSFRHISSHKSVVCKHWLRGLCKKGDMCEFVHQLNPKMIPECLFFLKFGSCSNPDCIFAHERMDVGEKECPWYNRGFCQYGADCRFKHVAKVAACPDFMAGFCAKGANCKFVHPHFDRLPVQDVRVERERTNAIPTFDGAGDRSRAPFAGEGGFRPRYMRDLSTVKCFKCGNMGHYANSCPNSRQGGGAGASGGGANRRGGGVRSFGPVQSIPSFSG